MTPHGNRVTSDGMKLQDYIAKVDGTHAAFARRAGVAERTIDRVVAGRGCRLEVADRIVSATHAKPTPSGGVVTFEELVPSKG